MNALKNPDTLAISLAMVTFVLANMALVSDDLRVGRWPKLRQRVGLGIVAITAVYIAVKLTCPGLELSRESDVPTEPLGTSPATR